MGADEFEDLLLDISKAQYAILNQTKVEKIGEEFTIKIPEQVMQKVKVNNISTSEIEQSIDKEKIEI